MKPPQMKAELGIKAISWHERCITMHATPDSTGGLGKFGELHQSPMEPQRYNLWVDSRFDFAEVVAYVQTLAAGGAA